MFLFLFLFTFWLQSPYICFVADSHLHRYESFVLGPGEKKVEMEIDTRKQVHSLLNNSVSDWGDLRGPIHRHLHISQRRPYPGQPSACSSSSELSRSFLGLQGRL